jgi:hypothetical protein
MRRGSFAPVGVLLIAALTIFSPVLADGAMHHCADLPNDAKRLACYDAEFGRPAATEAASATDPTRSTARATVTSAVTALELKRNGRFVATLANGQVWAQSELEPAASVVVGDIVTVRPASLGSYLIVTKAGIATRVKRVK